MEIKTTLDQVKQNAMELAVCNDRHDYFSGEWRGFYAFDPVDRDEHLKHLSVIWLLVSRHTSLPLEAPFSYLIIQYQVSNTSISLPIHPFNFTA